MIDWNTTDWNTTELPFDIRLATSHVTFRRKDQVHVLDMISIGIIDDTWLPKFSQELQVRLQELLDDPDG